MVGKTENGSKQIWTKGTAELGQPTPPNENTIFEIGSISKVFTGILLADLVLDGTVSLTDPISQYLPELESKPTGSITLVELSTHTSGLPRLPTNFSPSNLMDPYADYTEDMLLEFLVSHPLGDHPTEFSWDNYSNLGVGLLGYILTKATGLSYEELLSSRITSKLDMRDTVVALNAEQVGRFARPYNGALEEVLPWDLSVLVGAGGIRSTLKDLMKFVEANLNPDNTSIARALKLAQQVQQTNGTDSIGLGWGISESGNFIVKGHGGGTGGFRSYVGINSATNTGLAYLTNTSSDLKCVGKVVLWGSECTPEFGYPVPDAILDLYVGTYKDSTGIEIIITRRNKYLIYEIVGQEKNRMESLSESKFNIFNIATIEFEKDTNDHVPYFTLTQGEYVGKFYRVEESDQGEPETLR
ncbi:MAG: serine hydrolase [Bdellovibrionota bacterium]